MAAATAPPLVGLLADRLVIAFEPSVVSGVAASRSLAGWRLRSVARAPLPAGALVPSPLDRNLAGTEEVRAAVAHVVKELGAERGRAAVLLPDGIGRTVLLDTTPGVAAREYARFRLASTLPYPDGEAVIDVLPAGEGRVLAAAVRRPIVQEYEAVIAACGLVQDRLDLAPLAVLAGRLRRAGDGPEVDVILGEAALSLAAFRRGVLRVFRSRRRDPGPEEATRVAEEADRSALLAGDGAAPVLRLMGAGAGGLALDLAQRGRDAEVVAPPVAPVPAEAAELSWLAAALA